MTNSSVSMESLHLNLFHDASPQNTPPSSKSPQKEVTPNIRCAVVENSVLLLFECVITLLSSVAPFLLSTAAECPGISPSLTLINTSLHSKTVVVPKFSEISASQPFTEHATVAISSLSISSVTLSESSGIACHISTNTPLLTLSASITSCSFRNVSSMSSSLTTRRGACLQQLMAGNDLERVDNALYGTVTGILDGPQHPKYDFEFIIAIVLEAKQYSDQKSKRCEGNLYSPLIPTFARGTAATALSDCPDSNELVVDVFDAQFDEQCQALPSDFAAHPNTRLASREAGLLPPSLFSRSTSKLAHPRSHQVEWCVNKQYENKKRQDELSVLKENRNIRNSSQHHLLTRSVKPMQRKEFTRMTRKKGTGLMEEGSVEVQKRRMMNTGRGSAGSARPRTPRIADLEKAEIGTCERSDFIRTLH
ncbi:hypothetical protein BLNAU_22909 [Blattamonas nauphoetae]|uniref:Uncharacterized protein n=1 Tax=Blattamonas nauphoetae TaxID=2049346 RepID=A0ABQ9WRR0_9EUKA|nr:hypothetical protein BLNAU_22909 [Blattamonas nauphoetae]